MYSACAECYSLLFWDSNTLHGGSGVGSMATSNIWWEPPAAFDFKNPEEWPHWKQRFEQFRLASGLSDEEESRQVSTLLHCLGEEGKMYC